MKRKETSSTPISPNTLQTFGGDYHRLESEFRPKLQSPLGTTPRQRHSTKPGKGKRKKSAQA